MTRATASMSKSEILAVETLDAHGGDVAKAAIALHAMKLSPPSGHTPRSVSRAKQFLWEKYNRPPK